MIAKKFAASAGPTDLVQQQKPESHSSCSLFGLAHLPRHEQPPALGNEGRHAVAAGPAAARSRHARRQEFPLLPKHCPQSGHSLLWGRTPLADERSPRSSGGQVRRPRSPELGALGGRGEPGRRRSSTRRRASCRCGRAAGQWQRGALVPAVLLLHAVLHAGQVGRRRHPRSCCWHWQHAVTPDHPLVLGHGLKRHVLEYVLCEGREEGPSQHPFDAGVKNCERGSLMGYVGS